MKWTTRITKLLGCKYPILQGAFAGMGNWEFAAAVARTGAHGTITASVSRTPEKLREDIRNCREATAGTEGSFGVNLTYVSMTEEVMNGLLEVCIEERVPVETAAYKPDNVAKRIKGTGIPWIHKTARVNDAIYAEAMGVDAVIVVGLEGVGFKNPEQIPTLTTVTWGLREISVPFIAAGGIGDARGLLGVLAMGADGIMMGTAFLATQECSMSEEAKQTIVSLKPDDKTLIYRVLAKPNPDDYAEVMKMRHSVSLEKWLRMLERLNMHDPKWRETIDEDEATLPRRIGSRAGSLAAGVIEGIPTCQELVSGIVTQAEKLVGEWEFLKTG